MTVRDLEAKILELDPKERAHLKKLILESGDQADPSPWIDKTLLESREWLQVTLSSIADGVITSDNSGRAIFLNPVAQSLTGWTQETAVGLPLETLFQIFEDEPRRAVENPVTRALREGGMVTLAAPTLLLGKGMKEGFVDGSAAPIQNGKGKILGCVLVFRDATERKRGEEALRESEERWRLALDAGDLGAWNIDPSTNVLTSDERFRILFHGSTAPITYEEAFAAIHPEDRKRVRDGVAAATQPDGQAPYAEEYRVVHPDGTVRWLFGKGRSNFELTEEGRRLKSFDGTVLDITDQKRIEEDLRASDEFNRSLMDGTIDCLKVLDLNGRLLHMNAPGLCSMEIDDFGSICGKPWEDLWPAEAQGKIRQAVAEALAGSASTFQAFCPTAKGAPRWWDVSVNPVRDATNGNLLRLLSVSRDITAQKQSEETARLDEIRQAFLVKLADTLRPLSDPYEVQVQASRGLGEHLRVNRVAYFEFHGSDYIVAHDFTDGVQPLAGRYPSTSFGPDLLAAYRAGCTVVETDVAANPGHTEDEHAGFAGIQTQAFIGVPLVKGGALVAGLTVHTSAPREWTAAEVALVEQVAERTWAAAERARVEEALRRSEERMRIAVATTKLGQWGLDLRTLELFCSETCKANYGRPLDEPFTYGQLWQMVHPGDLDRVQGEVRLAIETRTDYDTEYRTVWSDGSLHWAMVRGRATYDTDGTPSFMDGMSLDITDRKRAEQDRERLLGELQAQDRRKDEFLAMLSHELRSPLAPISNAVQLLRLHSGEDPVQQQARIIIERQVARLKYLIDDLLEVSRITTGRVQLRQDLISLSDIVAGALETARPLISQRRHEIIVALPPQPVWLRGDAARLEQVVVNLLNNAAKYTEEGGHIWLTAEGEGEEVALRIRDTGIGIAPDLLPHVFGLFTQADKSLARSEGGLGIGLALVQQLVELHGGRVEAQSALGSGSEFTMRLPVISSPPLSAPPVERAAPESGKNCRVLVVDDSVDSAESLALLLSLWCHDVRTAYDGPSALEAAREHRPDIVLLDIGLPKMDGYEVARKLREQSDLQSTTLIAMTGYGQDSDRQLAWEAGFDHHLVKPIDTETIRQILAAASEAVIGP